MAELDTNVTETTEPTETTQTTPTEQAAPAEPNAESAEIARLKRELQKQIDKNDQLATENKNQKAQLRANKSAEEQKAEEEKEAREAIEKELAELRKERAVSNSSKKAFVFLQDEQAANDVASYLYGAEDVDAALDAIQKAWTAREKALRLEYGKIPAPGAGASDGPLLTREQLDAMSYKERADFAAKHPDEYNKLMGR